MHQNKEMDQLIELERLKNDPVAFAQAIIDSSPEASVILTPRQELLVSSIRAVLGKHHKEPVMVGCHDSPGTLAIMSRLSLGSIKVLPMLVVSTPRGERNSIFDQFFALPAMESRMIRHVFETPPFSGMNTPRMKWNSSYKDRQPKEINPPRLLLGLVQRL